jgi:Spy/CpxP family protein refolding chaperone
MKKTILILTIVALLTGVFALVAFAYGRGCGGCSMGYGASYNNVLGLTLEQQEKVLAIRQEFQIATQTLRFELQKKNLELQNLWLTEPQNQAAIDAKIKEITILELALTKKNLEMRDKIASVLTPEQRLLWNSNGMMGGLGCGGGCMGMGCGY